ncbi:MAG: MbtH family NRPS accessory protein [Symploca sp. SIO1B1]|nr:MbtH family NRPS accessory protein [Symploca sp. SIO1B1]
MKDNSVKQTLTEYAVVVNQEGQYSIWPLSKDIPLGWKSTGFNGSKENCLAHIAEVWTDIRPKSLQDALSDDIS